MRKSLLILLLPLILLSCNKPGNPALSKIDIDGHEASVVLFDKVENTESIKLSEIAMDFKLIPLETKRECMIGYAYYHVSEKYIVAVNPYEKILLFDGQGKFLQEIGSSGKGPREYSSAITALDEDQDIIYVADESKEYFLTWDLKTGNYLKDIPRLCKGRLKNLLVTEDNTLICAPVVGYNKACSYFVYEQNMKGEMISGVDAPKIDKWTDSNVKLLHSNGSGYNYQPMTSDTVFLVQETKLAPTWIFDFGSNNESLKGKAGWHYFRYKFESPRFFLGTIYRIDRIEIDKIEGGMSSRSYNDVFNLLIDKKTNQINTFDFIENDFLGKDSTHIANYSFQENNIFYQPQSAINLLELCEKAINEPSIKPELKLRMQKLLDTVEIEDNPILLVGKFRK